MNKFNAKHDPLFMIRVLFKYFFDEEMGQWIDSQGSRSMVDLGSKSWFLEKCDCKVMETYKPAEWSIEQSGNKSAFHWDIGATLCKEIPCHFEQIDNSLFRISNWNGRWWNKWTTNVKLKFKSL